MMARVESIRFAFQSLELYHDHHSTTTTPQAVGFHLKIRELEENGDCRLQEVLEHKVFIPNSMFGRRQHRNYVAHILRQAGWSHSRGRPSLEVILDALFCHANSLLVEQDHKINNEPDQYSSSHPRSSIPTILLCFKKYVRYEEEEEGGVDDLDELEALELSMRATSFEDSPRHQGGAAAAA